MVAAPRVMTGGALPYFSSAVSLQRGRGWGGVLRSLFRGITPIFKKPIVKRGLKSLGKRAATALVEAGQSALKNEQSFGPALKKAGKHEAEKLLKAIKQSAHLQPDKKRRKSNSPISSVSVSRKPTLVVKRKKKRPSTNTASTAIHGRDIFSS